ncbi:MAG: prepilin-type N-terminal cleavage/methylation domain-containing protein [Armatimonadetes bacterium]|nr:prepilin-type N-terminal cleavage/methylation domain-containing protein [Armatimonadota bacterium]
MLQRRKGFTLIELLVVIAIIAILAAILFPVFARARDKVHPISCLSNMKQVGNALMMYTQDYNETLPDQPGNCCFLGFFDEAALNNCPFAWVVRLAPYVKSVRVRQCPSTAKSWSVVTNGDSTQLFPKSTNYVLSGLAKNRKLADIGKPARAAHITEWASNDTNAYL